MQRDAILFVTVGTGDRDRRQASLFDPITKSIRQGIWQEVVLLPSLETVDAAETLRCELADVNIAIEPLPEPRIENDTDKSYVHFERVIGERLAQGIRADDMVADFTRGTKAMSAALVLAAFRHGVRQLRYIDGPRDDSGRVVPGQEQISGILTIVASGHRLLDQARLLMEKGNFAAVLTVLPDLGDDGAPSEEPATEKASGEEAAATEVPGGEETCARARQNSRWPVEFHALFRYPRELASFYSAWDRLAYKEAWELLDKKGFSCCVDAQWKCFEPSPEVIEHLRKLAQEPPRSNFDRAQWVRVRAADLLANGRRRIRDRQFEDAYLRAYRIAEILGHVRLATHGFDSQRLPKDNDDVQAVQGELKSLGYRGVSVAPKTKGELLQFERDATVKLLSRLGDPMAEDLQLIGQKKLARARNKSLLIHGFMVTEAASQDELNGFFNKLDSLLRKDDPDGAPANLAAAHSADLSRKRRSRKHKPG